MSCKALCYKVEMKDIVHLEGPVMKINPNLRSAMKGWRFSIITADEDILSAIAAYANEDIEQAHVPSSVTIGSIMVDGKQLAALIVSFDTAEHVADTFLDTGRKFTTRYKQVSRPWIVWSSACNYEKPQTNDGLFSSRRPYSTRTKST